MTKMFTASSGYTLSFFQTLFRNSKNMSFVTAEFLKTSAGIPSDPVVFPFFMCRTASSNSFLSISSPPSFSGSASNSSHKFSSSVGMNFLFRNFFQTAASSSGPSIRFPLESNVGCLVVNDFFMSQSAFTPA